MKVVAQCRQEQSHAPKLGVGGGSRNPPAIGRAANMLQARARPTIGLVACSAIAAIAVLIALRRRRNRQSLPLTQQPADAEPVPRVENSAVPPPAATAPAAAAAAAAAANIQGAPAPASESAAPAAAPTVKKKAKAKKKKKTPAPLPPSPPSAPPPKPPAPPASSPLNPDVTRLEDELLAGLQLATDCKLEPVVTAAAGRGFAARRDIKEGEVVLRAPVQAWAPAWPCDASQMTDVEARVCGVDMGAGASFLASYGSGSGNDVDVAAHAHDAAWLAGEVQALWLLAIRCALLSRDSPPTWAALRRLEHHADRRPAHLQRLVLGAAVRLSRALQLGADVVLPSAEVAALLGGLLTNAFGVRGAEERARRLDMRPTALAVSLAASMFNHDCTPNIATDHRLLSGDAASKGSSTGVAAAGGANPAEEAAAFVLTFRAAACVPAGTACTIAYIACEEPNYIRQRELRRAKQFACVCAKCTDPLETDTCASCLRCPSCDGGWQVPAAPACEAWVCGRCGATSARAEVERWDALLRAQLAAVLDSAATAAAADEKCAAAAQRGAATRSRLRGVMAEALKRCHPNHALLLQAHLALVACAFPDAEESAAPPGWKSQSAAKAATSPPPASPQELRLAAARAALELAGRVLPLHDPQKGDLLFTIGRTQHHLAQDHLRARARAPEAGAAAGKAAAAAAEALRDAASSMMLAAREFACTSSEGDSARPCVAAKEYARLCMRQGTALEGARAR